MHANLGFGVGFVAPFLSAFNENTKIKVLSYNSLLRELI